MSRSAKRHLAEQGRDFTRNRSGGSLAAGGDLKSTRRPYTAPVEVEGSKSAGVRGKVVSP